MAKLTPTELMQRAEAHLHSERVHAHDCAEHLRAARAALEPIAAGADPVPLLHKAQQHAYAALLCATQEYDTVRRRADARVRVDHHRERMAHERVTEARQLVRHLGEAIDFYAIRPAGTHAG